MLLFVCQTIKNMIVLYRLYYFPPMLQSLIVRQYQYLIVLLSDNECASLLVDPPTWGSARPYTETCASNNCSLNWNKKKIFSSILFYKNTYLRQVSPNLTSLTKYGTMNSIEVKLSSGGWAKLPLLYQGGDHF